MEGAAGRESPVLPPCPLVRAPGRAWPGRAPLPPALTSARTGPERLWTCSGLSADLAETEVVRNESERGAADQMHLCVVLRFPPVCVCVRSRTTRF